MSAGNGDNQKPRNTSESSETRSYSQGAHSIGFWWLVLAISVVIALQVGWLLGLLLLFGLLEKASLSSLNMSSLGQAGDLFGGVNALFTGLAFAGLVFTIMLQRRDLQMQSEALDLQSKELAATRAEVQKSAEAQDKQVSLSVIATLVDIYTMQRDIMERGGLRGELWRVEREFAKRVVRRVPNRCVTRKILRKLRTEV